MMASLDAAELLDYETMVDHFRNDRWYTPLPSLHVSTSLTPQRSVMLSFLSLWE